MSYRNDHDAALARVDALEHELTQLVAENASLRAEREEAERRLTHSVVPAPAPVRLAPAHPVSAGSYSNAQAAGLIAGMVLLGFVLPMVCVVADRQTDTETSSTSDTETSYPISEVEACLATTPSTPIMTRWDHISYVDVNALRSTELPCHLALPRLIHSVDWNRTEQQTLSALEKAEQRLDGIVEGIEDDRAGRDQVPHNTIRIDVANDYMSALRERNELVSSWNYIHIRR